MSEGKTVRECREQAEEDGRRAAHYGRLRAAFRGQGHANAEWWFANVASRERKTLAKLTGGEGAG